MAPRPPLVALKNVRLQDGQRPLFEGVDIAVEPRTRAALVGRNGAGKSTLMKMVMGLIEPDAGDRSVQAGTRFAWVPQEPVITGETLLDYAGSGGADHWTAEAWLATFGLDPAKLVVSHDRAFLNRVTQSCHWLEGRRVRTLNKGFAAFDEWSAKVQEEEAQSLQRLNKTIERETETFYRSITARRTRNEGRARSLDALRADRAERLKDVPRELNLGVDSGVTSGKLVADLKGVSKSFGDRTVIKPFTTRVIRGDRLAIVGPNGAGKTTLVKILLGELAPDAGTVKLGANLEPVYLDQSREGLKSDMTLWDALTPGGGDSVLVRGVSKHVAAYAKDFLFQEGQLRQPISTLSGGERNRLLLARALAKPANMLVLDEPTNDLDMDTLDKLEELLETYDGTLILVSHDRDFVDRLATSTIAMNGRGDIVETPGGWTDFIRQNPGFLARGEGRGTRDEWKKASAGSAPAPLDARPSTPAAPKKPGKLTFKDAHRLKELEGLLVSLPEDIARHDAILSDPDLYVRDRKAFDRATANADRARALLAAAEEEWLELEARREALSA